MGFLDFLFPKYCVICKELGSYLCANCFTHIVVGEEVSCLECGKASMNGETHPICKKRYSINGAFTSARYNATAKKLIYAFKYKPFVTDLRYTLVDFLEETLIQNERFMDICAKQPTLIAIPLHSTRKKWRGYNQSWLLAEELGKRFGLLAVDILTRNKKTSSQVGLTEKERKENITGAFSLDKKRQSIVQDKIIFLVDDVVTTGSTLLEAAKVSKQSGAKEVWGITFAKD